MRALSKPRYFLGILLLSGLASACGHSESEWQSKLRELETVRGQLRDMTGERDRIQAQVQDLEGSNAAMRQRLTELGEDVSRLQREGAQTASELEAARAREAELRRRQQAQEARLSTFRGMLARFQSMISAGRLRVRVVRGRMVIELPSGILFESGQATLRPEGQEVLRSVASVLRDIPNRDFLVAGHTDNVRLGRGGRFADNWDLSTARATNVVRFLAENQVATARLGAAGFAEFQPARNNDTEENRAQNRRVEIVLMPNLDELPDLSSLEDSSGGGGAQGASPAPAPAPSPAPAPQGANPR